MNHWFSHRIYSTLTSLWIYCAVGGIGGLSACGAASSEADAVQDSADLTHHAGYNDAKEAGQSSDQGAVREPVGVPSGLLRAEAWPKGAGDARWRALEDGKGTFVDEGIIGAHTFVFSSLSDSLPAAGISVHFPSTLQEEQVPTMLAVSLSPTPIRVTREGWPSIAGLLRHAGFAEFDATPGDTIFFAFEKIERVSLIQLQMWASTSRASIGVGHVRLVHQRAVEHLQATRRVDLVPVQDAHTLPEDANILGTDGRITLPHHQRAP